MTGTSFQKPKNMDPSAFVMPVFRLLLAFIFLYAAIDKILSPSAFAAAIAGYQLIPEAWTNPAAILIPWLELYCALGLLIGIFSRGSALILIALLFVFILALLSVIIRGMEIDCGCFGAGREVGWQRIIEDILLLFPAVYIYVYGAGNYALENTLMRKVG